MSVSVAVELNVTGTGPVEDSLREGIEWLSGRPNTPEYHELFAHIAMVAMRSHWRTADRLRQAAREREQRQARAAARRKP